MVESNYEREAVLECIDRKNDYEGKEELMGVIWEGFGVDNTVQERVRRLKLEYERRKSQGMTAKLLTYSDGSHRGGNGPHAEGTYAWVIRGWEGGETLDIQGGGMVHGQAEDITSTRAEALGALSVLTTLLEWGIAGEAWILHRLDNQAVTKQELRLTEGRRRLEEDVESLEEHIRASDPDVWGQMVSVISKFCAVDLLWHRGHPERHKPGDMRLLWTDHDEYSITAFVRVQSKRVPRHQTLISKIVPCLRV